MITEKLQKAINDQITAELWSSNLYLQMSYFLETFTFRCHISLRKKDGQDAPVG